MLGQSEMTILVDPRLPSKIYQGITTEITGEGNRAAPVNDAMLEADRAGYEHYSITPDWRTLRASISRALRSRAWASTWPATSARPRCAGWCSVTRTCSQPPRNSTR